MDANHSTDPARGNRNLSAYERLAVAAAIISIASLAAPWYRLGFDPSLDRSGLEAFDFGAAAIVLTMVAVLTLIHLCRTGRPPAVPPREGALVAAAGIWTAVIATFLVFNPPSVDVDGLETRYSIGFGLVIILVSAGALAVSGLRIRDRDRDRGAMRAQEDQSPGVSSPSRSS